MLRVFSVMTPVTIRGLRLGGLSEDLANSVGLFDVLNMTIDMPVDAARGESGQYGVQIVASPGQSGASGPSAAREDHPQVPAPVTPTFTSSSTAPIPGPGLAMAMDDVLEPAVVDLESQPAVRSSRSVMMGGSGTDVEEVPSISAEALVPFPAVTNLGGAGMAADVEEERSRD